MSREKKPAGTSPVASTHLEPGDAVNEYIGEAEDIAFELAAEAEAAAERHLESRWS